jgi:hypothetical protein
MNGLPYNTIKKARIHQARTDTKPGGKIRDRGNGGDPDSHTPAHESIITVAPFRAWRNSLSIVAEGPPGAPQQPYLRYGRRVLCFKAGDAASGDLKYALTVMLPAIPGFVIRS